MSGKLKLNAALIENVKRVRMVKLYPGERGLTIVGGDNCQGKTSVLDAILYALGGEKYRPSELKHEGGMMHFSVRHIFQCLRVYPV